MAELHPLLADRWSPRAFHSTDQIGDADLHTLLEAARWAPSAANTQPCRFVVGRRDEETHKRIFTNLSPANQRWAGTAALLIVAAHVNRTPSGRALPHAVYDLGQAVAHLTLQAGALGLHVHQIVDFHPAGLRADLDLPDGVHPRVVAAIGRLGSPSILPTDLRRLETALRRRRPLTELVLR